MVSRYSWRQFKGTLLASYEYNKGYRSYYLRASLPMCSLSLKYIVKTSDGDGDTKDLHPPITFQNLYPPNIEISLEVEPNSLYWSLFRELVRSHPYKVKVDCFETSKCRDRELAGGDALTALLRCPSAQYQSCTHLILKCAPLLLTQRPK